MNGQPSPRYGVLAMGFSTFEKSTIESFFRIAAQRPPGWWLTDQVNDAEVVLLNASTEQDVAGCRSLILPRHKVIIVGSSDFGTGWIYLPRPIRLMVTLTKLGEMIASGGAESGQHEDTVPAGLEELARRSGSGPASASITVPQARVPQPLPAATKSSVTPPSLAVVRPTLLSQTLPAQAPGLVLVVDDSDVALKFMQSRLRQLGYVGQLARSGEEALAMVASYDFKFVFLDVMMAGLDGYQTCRAIKQYKSKSGSPPVVVMLTSRGGTIDKIRGSMAGSDAYLTKPLNERLLAAVLAKHDPK